jgi:hypothetical protein
MKQQDPFRFLSLTPDGQRAYQAYDLINSYYQGCLMQYSRIYDIWRASSAIKVSLHDQTAFMEKRRQMQQVIRDIHYLLVSLQVIWKTVQRLCDVKLYPHFTPMSSLRDQWAPYFKQYREPRNTFEHFDDQVLGPDSRSNSPGYGVHLASDGGFSLGKQQSVFINKQTQDQLVQFKAAFEACIDSIVGAKP